MPRTAEAPTAADEPAPQPAVAGEVPTDARVDGRVVLVDHYDSYTYNLLELIERVSGHTPAVVQHDQVSLTALARASHLVLSPGPGHPGNPGDFALGPEVFGLGVPLLGVCLGLQAMVVAFGGEVTPIEPEHGQLSRITHDGTGVFACVPQHVEVVRYHSLAATKVPDVLRVTARSEDGVVMGVRHRRLSLEAVQFHPESILSQAGDTMLANFLAAPPGPAESVREPT